MKPEYRLHKLPEGFIITSDEKDTVGYLPIVLTKFNGLEQADDGDDVYYHIKNGSKIVIAQQDQIDFSTLSEEEQKEIGWFDVEKLTKKSYEKFTPMESKLSLDELIQRTGGYNVGFQEGFQKAQELLSDRKFTLEEMKKAYNKGRNHGASYKHQCGDYDCIEEIIEADKWSEKVESEFIQFLSQPKTWEVEIEMEYKDGYGNWYDYTLTIQESIKTPFTLRPKFTNGKVKITKLL